MYHSQYEKTNPNYPKSVAMGFFSEGLENEFETAVVNEPSVFDPLKFYYILMFGTNVRNDCSHGCHDPFFIIFHLQFLHSYYS